MKKYLTIVAALLMLNTASAFAQTTEPTEAQAKCGETVTLTATADAGYTFVQWQDGNKDNPRDITITDTTTIYDYVATFTKATIAVIAQANDANMGTVTGSGDYEFGSSVELEATPKSKCYKFVQWTDGVTTAKRTITVGATAEANTYTAVFAEEEFTVKVTSPVTGGKVTIAKK